MSDIVDRLREQGKDAFARQYSLGMFKLCTEAADEIERLRDLLKPFARAAEVFDGWPGSYRHPYNSSFTTFCPEGVNPFDKDDPRLAPITYGHCRAAREAVIGIPISGTLSRTEG